MTVKDIFKRNLARPGYLEREFLLFEGERYTWGETYRQAIRFANTLRALRSRSDLPFNVGVLMENNPEFVFTFLGCAFAGAAMIGLSTLQKGAALARDVNHCDCQILITEPKFLPDLAAIRGDLRAVPDGCLLVDERRDRASALSPGAVSLDVEMAELEARVGPAFREEPEVELRPEDLLTVIFTSGSTGAPKGVVNSHKKLIALAGITSQGLGYTDRDTHYGVMPLFHANSVIMALMPALYNGGRFATARRFSARGFLSDVRRFGATAFNYVGKPFAYILATPERPDDADNTLRIAIGNGASAEQLEHFQRRFGLDHVVELFGSSEGGGTTLRAKGDPRGSVGAMPPGIRVLNARMEECPPGEVGADGKLRNYEEAVGEIVNVAGIGTFEGYYKNPEATAAKTAGNRYRSGDLGYYRVFERDGVPTRFLYFVGRTDDWIRKDGENFLTDPVENIVARFDDVVLACVYGVPCSQGDERVMAAIVLKENRQFDPGRLHRFLREQEDLCEKWMPDFVRVSTSVPQTPTAKVIRRALKSDYFNLDRVTGDVYWRERGETTFKPFSRSDYERLRAEFVRNGREELLR